MDARERTHFGEHLWAGHAVEGDEDARRAGFWSTFVRLRSDLRSGASSLLFYDDFTPREVEVLERKLSELQAKARRARELLDKRHALIMA